MNEELLQNILESNEAILITLLRIYDIGMAELKLKNTDLADRLVDMHASGIVLSPMPYISETIGQNVGQNNETSQDLDPNIY